MPSKRTSPRLRQRIPSPLMMVAAMQDQGHGFACRQWASQGKMRHCWLALIDRRTSAAAALILAVPRTRSLALALARLLQYGDERSAAKIQSETSRRGSD
jgi:hypothetical protein